VAARMIVIAVVALTLVGMAVVVWVAMRVAFPVAMTRPFVTVFLVTMLLVALSGLAGL